MKSENKKRFFRIISFRAKALMIILPVLVSSLVISNFFLRESFRRALDSAGSRLMSYKADQFVKYTDMQLNFLKENRMENNPVYMNAMKEAVLTHAVSMAESVNQTVFAVLSDSTVDFSTCCIEEGKTENDEIKKIAGEQFEGWVTITHDREKWVGLTFSYQPLDWQVFILEKESSFYSTVNRAEERQKKTTLLFVLLGAAVTVVFINYLTYPIKSIAGKIRNIKNMDEIGEPLEIVYPDEIGQLAYEFNRMSSRLERSYTRLKSLAVKEASARKDVSRRELETLNVLGRTSDYKDPETGAHIARVGYYSKMIAKLYGEDEEAQDLIFYSSPLHDVGKIGIPDAILLKPAKLTDEEFKIIKTHTTIAYNILKNSESKYLQAGALIGLTHHEKYDGTGYPEGLAGEDIPLFGRIVAIADVFDALTTLRPYKEPWPVEKAWEFLKTQGGRHFDPELLDLFLGNFDTVKEIYEKNQDQ